MSAAIEIRANLCSIADWERRWHIEFEPSKFNAICVSLKRDVEEHPPLFMNGVLIKESKVLSILGFDLGLYDRFYSMTLQTEAGMSKKNIRVSWHRGFVLGLSGFCTSGCRVWWDIIIGSQCHPAV